MADITINYDVEDARLIGFFVQSNIFFVTVFYPKDGAIIELKLDLKHALSCPPVQPTPSPSQIPTLLQTEFS